MSRLALVALCLLAVGCGKKGPPLAPIVRIPAAIEQIATRRAGSDVYVTLTVPRQNVDQSAPADVARVDVYGYTGRVAPARARFADLGRVVASIPVAPPPRPGEIAAPDTGAAPPQGAAITIVDRLTADELVAGPVEPAPAGAGRAPVADRTASPLRRYYLAVPFSPRGRPGPPGAAAEFVLAGVPDAPAAPDVAYDESTLTVRWPPAGGVVGFVTDRELSREAPPFAEDALPAAAVPDLPTGPTRYNVYRRQGPDPLALPAPAATAQPWQAAPAPPLNAEPLTAFTLTEPPAFEVERCYTVRAVRGAAPALVESDASPAACVRAVDVFPPRRPPAPALVAGEGAISLIWEPSADADLGGYVVLRGEAGDDTLQPLTPSPIAEARYRDTTVVAGRRYVYAIVAVDDRVPLGNASPPSERAEETAR